MKIIVKPKHSNITKGGEKRMRYSKIILALGVAVFVLATLITSWAAEDIRSTKHNLITNTNIGATGTTEVCIFCHTPHGARTPTNDAEKAFPLWNRNMDSMPQTYTVYASPNFDAPAIDTLSGKPRGVSLACLSCHDGTLAFDALLNFPGSGSIDTITFSGTNNVDADGKMKNNPALHSGEFPMLGQNLSNDHPISMPIPCGKDPQFDSTVAGAAEKQICDNLDKTELSANRVSPLYRGSNVNVLPPDKRDRIRAYPTGGGGTAYIECASCHNPHEATSTRFLRKPSWDTNDQYYKDVDAVAVNEADPTKKGIDANRNAGSLLCLSCHQK